MEACSEVYVSCNISNMTPSSFFDFSIHLQQVENTKAATPALLTPISEEL